MSGVRKGPPRFSMPSGDVKKAVQTLDAELLAHALLGAHALRNHKSAEPAAWPRHQPRRHWI
jgi:hypothetical protein